MILEERPKRILAEQFDGTPFGEYRFRQEDDRWKVKTCEGWRWIEAGDWLSSLETDPKKVYLRKDVYIQTNYRDVNG